jgi:uncharacterized protein (TIGR02453 family)
MANDSGKVTKTPIFTPPLFAFFDELAQNNRKDWFEANRPRFEEDVKKPMLRFIEAMVAPLSEISLYVIADPRPNGGSMFRIHRDTRFSNDKTPYKTHAAAQFRHASSGDVHGPGYYLHLQRGSVFGGAGIWRPEPAALRKIRDEIANSPEKWEAAKSNAKIGSTRALEGDALKKVPAGFDPAHPCADDLKRKDFITSFQFTEEDVFSPNFVELFAQACRETSPLMGFLARAVGLAW